VTIRIDFRVLVGLLTILAIGGALAIGMYLGGQAAPAPVPAASSAVSETLPQQGTDLVVPTTIPSNELAAEPRISAADALAQHGQPGVTFVDVRDPASFAAGHIQGAINVPEAEIATRLSELPLDQDLILYCS